MKRALTIVLLLFGMIAVASTGNEEKELLEAKKKAVYYEIRAELLEGNITIEQAQRRWKKELKKINEGAD